MKNQIHPTAEVSPNAILGKGNIIGPFAIITDGCIIGDFNYIGPHCIIGEEPEKITATSNFKVIMGDNNILYKQVTIDGGATRKTEIGNNNYFLKNSHVGHDSVIKNNVRLSCNSVVGGYTYVQDYCIFGINATCHQRSFVREGTFIGGNAFFKGVSKAYHIYAGVPAKPIKFNEVAWERNLK